jgi:hypothetical protein
VIRIKTYDGEIVATSRHKLHEALEMQAAGRGIQVGGELELSYADLIDDDGNSADPDVPEERWIDLTGATIEEVPA